jgi:hypothetical protein
VDAALERMRKARRMTPEVVTPLVAYVGQVMLGVSGGRWTKAPTTRRLRVYMPMVEPSKRVPLRAAVDVMLLPYRGGGSAVDAGNRSAP